MKIVKSKLQNLLKERNIIKINSESVIQKILNSIESDYGF
jgi:hypothetical protein